MYVIVDGLDETAADRALERAVMAFLRLVSTSDGNWRVLATSRTTTMLGKPEWRAFFRGAPLQGTAERALADVRHLELRRLTPPQLRQALEYAPSELRNTISADPTAIDLLSLPETLALLAELPPATHVSLRYRHAVLDRYWDSRITSAEREALVLQIAKLQRNLGTTAVPLDTLTIGGTILTELQHDNVVLVAGGKVSFAHEPLVEYIRGRFPVD